MTFAPPGSIIFLESCSANAWRMEEFSTVATAITNNTAVSQEEGKTPSVGGRNCVTGTQLHTGDVEHCGACGTI